MSSIKLRESVDDLLGATERTIHFREIKAGVYAVDITVGIALVIIVTAFYGAQIKPLFLPFGTILFTIGIVELMVFAESVSFKLIELGIADSSSTKLIIVRRINKRAIVALTVAVSICTLLVIPSTGQAMQGAVSGSWEHTMESGTLVYNVTVGSKDPLDTVSVKSVGLRLVYGSSVTVTINTTYNGQTRTVYSELMVDPATGMHDVPLTSTDSYREYTLTFIKPRDQPVTVGYSVSSKMSTIYTVYIPVLACIYISVAAPVLAFAQVKKRKYIRDSIYENI